MDSLLLFFDTSIKKKIVLLVNITRLIVMIGKLTINNWWKLNAFLFGVYGSVQIILWLKKRYAKHAQRYEINEAFFSSDRPCNDCDRRRNINCTNQYCYNYILSKMLSFINGARHSIYICMNIFTSQDLGEAILKAYERGVSVKIIANETTAYATGSQIKTLAVNGIPIKFQKKGKSVVHHKFCLLDSERSSKKSNVLPPAGARKIPDNGAVMSGSMNWTFQAMNTNWENVVITSDDSVKKKFHAEFLNIWSHGDIIDFY